MNLQMLNAVGPGVMQGQQAAANLADQQMVQQARMKAIADAAAQEKASAWMKGGNLAAAFGGLAQPVPGGASPVAMPGPLPSPVAAPQGGGIGPAPMAMTPPPPAPPVSAPAKDGTAYGEPTIDRLTRLLIGEAGGEDDKGQLAVASVIRNRARQSGLSLDDVIAAPGQFEPYNNKRRWGELQGISTDNPAYVRARTNALRILQDQAADPTGGADHFYSPSGQKSFGRPAPSWDDGSGADMGRHRFFKLGYKGDGVARSDVPDGEAAPDLPLSAQAAALGHPSEPDYAQPYSPIDSLRMTMQLMDFIGGRYKEVTGEELAPHLLLDQVDRVAKLSNQFTGAQRLAVQQGIAGLRATTALDVQDSKSATSMRNTDKRTDTQVKISDDRNATSRANTGDRVNQSDVNSRRSNDTSRANTDKRVTQSDTNNKRTNDTSRANTGDRVTSANRNADNRNDTSTTNAGINAKGRTDAARIQMGKELADDIEANPTPAARTPRVDPLKAKTPNAWAPPAGLPAATGRPNGQIAKDSQGRPVAKVVNGKWVKP